MGRDDTVVRGLIRDGRGTIGVLSVMGFGKSEGEGYEGLKGDVEGEGREKGKPNLQQYQRTIESNKMINPKEDVFL